LPRLGFPSDRLTDQRAARSWLERRQDSITPSGGGATSSCHVAKEKPFADLIDKPALKLLFRHPSMDADVFRAIVEAVGPHGTILYGSTASAPDARTHIEIMAPGVSKASALQRLCDVRNIDKDDTIAFGDMPNDIEMLAWAGHGVAMGNGHHEVKAIANEVTLTNDEDGVGVILERELARR
jgi:Cof subfamily protein (haloacid dehalogenase superfamily)